jgi:glucuronoarabinoxylan endo-1,4-beta-xylanase
MKRTRISHITAACLLAIWTAVSATATTINLASEKQVIRGFGAATVWQGLLTTNENDALWTTLGLSICRVRIDPSGAWDQEIANAKAAQARGAIVFASPWSPPPHLKSNNDPIGGYLLPQNYGAYRDWLNSFASQIPGIYAISVQNEPNINVTYESCTWTEQQMFDFIVNYGGGFTARLMMPETFNYLQTFSDSILSNPTGAANTDIYAYHWYGANRFGLNTQAYNLGKDIWMTEHFSDDQTIAGAIGTAVDIHKQLTLNMANAYCWWWVREPACNLIGPDASYINPRGYVMGQFAKFVRPGSIRVDATGAPNNVYVTAYKNAGKLVIVVVNAGSKKVVETFSIANGSVASLASYSTSASTSLTPGPGYTVVNGSFSATFPPKSITTFVQ